MSSQHWASFVFSQAPQCCFYPHHSPTCRFRRRLRERGKVWLEQLVALATLCATTADWNRNWPIHVSLQAGSGPCLVLTDYLISIQTARVSAPLLRSLEKRPRPVSFWKPPEPSSLLPFPVLITHSFVPLLFFFFPVSSSPSSPIYFSWSLIPSLLTVCLSLFCFVRRWGPRFWSLKSVASSVLPHHHHHHPQPSSPSPFHRLSTWKGILCFRCIKGLALSTGWIHQGPWKTYTVLQLQFLWKGREEEEEEGGWVSEGGSWKGLLCSFIGSTIKNIPSVNLAVQHNTNDDALALEPFYFFWCCTCVCLKRCSQLCVVTHNSSNSSTGKVKSCGESKQEK